MNSAHLRTWPKTPGRGEAVSSTASFDVPELFFITPVLLSIWEILYSRVPNGPIRGQQPYPRLPRWFWDDDKRMDWQEGSSRPLARGVQSFSHAPGSGVSRGTRINFFRSLRVTSAARSKTSSLNPW